MTNINTDQGAPASTGISKRLFHLTGRVALYQGIGLALTFGLQTLISRSCGPSGVGAYTIFISWLAILSVVTVPGMESCVVYFLPRLEKEPDLQRLVVRICLLITGVLSLVCGALLIGAGRWPMEWIGLPPGARIAFAFALVFFSIGKLLDAVFLGRKDAPLIGFYNIVRLGLRVILCLPLLVYPHAAWKILFSAVAVEGGVTAVLRYLRIQKRYDNLIVLGAENVRDHSVSTKTIIHTSFPMLGISLIDTLSPFLDKAILSLMVPIGLVGIYRISDYVGSLNSLFVAPFVAFWPFISSLTAERQLDKLGAAYKNITLAIIALMLPFSLALFELSGFVLSLFGPAFASQGSAVFYILAVGAMFDAIAGPAGAVLRLTDHFRLSLLINLILLLVYCAATVLLTRQYGIIGAAVARTATLILGNAINIVANHKLLHIFPYTKKHAALLACGASIVAIRLCFLSHHFGLTMHFAIAFAEVLTFSGCTLIILRKQLQQVADFLKTFVSARG